MRYNAYLHVYNDHDPELESKAKSKASASGITPYSFGSVRRRRNIV